MTQAARARQDQLLGQILDRMNMLPSQLRQGVADELWSRIPTYVDEYAYAPNQGANVPLLVSAQTTTLELIRSIVASVPAGATAVIQLGSQIIPIAEGITVISPVTKLIGTSDTRSITATGAGPLSLWLAGEQQPTFGVLQP